MRLIEFIIEVKSLYKDDLKELGTVIMPIPDELDDGEVDEFIQDSFDKVASLYEVFYHSMDKEIIITKKIKKEN